MHNNRFGSLVRTYSRSSIVKKSREWSQESISPCKRPDKSWYIR
uniref:Uncharacterized protein n=1 Tax=Rhizophora mucronata TaxID=61149 RepID=A0A2P2KB77_RHIMU